MTRKKYVLLLIVILLAGWLGRKQDESVDIAFVNDAAAAGLFEVQIGKLAISKGSMSEIKNLGQQMVKDQNKVNQELKQLALKKKIELPESLGPTMEVVYKNISLKDSKEFDAEYIRLMMMAYEQNLNKFEAASRYMSDSDLRAWASRTLSALRARQEALGIITFKVNNDAKAARAEVVSKL